MYYVIEGMSNRPSYVFASVAESGWVYPPGHSRTTQWRRVSEMRANVTSGTPDAVKRQILARLQAELLPEDPSWFLCREVFLQHAASVAQLGGPEASRMTKRPRETRSAVMMSGVPSKCSRASWNEYSAWTGSNARSAARHAEQRDAMQVTGGELYHLVRKTEVDLDKLYYETDGTKFWMQIADPRNLGNQKHNKVSIVFAACMVSNDARCQCRINSNQVGLEATSRSTRKKSSFACQQRTPTGSGCNLCLQHVAQMPQVSALHCCFSHSKALS